ncbi:hypothetical protein D3C72_597490 [compost metagenome]
MSVNFTAYRLLNHPTRPAAPAPAPVVNRAVMQPQALGVSGTSFQAMLEAIRQDATVLLNSWQQAAPATIAPLRDSLTRLRSLIGRLLTAPSVPAPAPQPAPKPAPKPNPLPVGGKEPATRIIAEQAYSQNKNSAAQKELREERKRQSARAKIAPGLTRGPHQGKDTKRIREIAASSKTEQAYSAQGFKKTASGWQGPTLKNPNDPSGKFDAHAFQPHWVFSSKEDSFPVRPDYDKSGSTKNDLKTYDHGVVGGDQPLEGGFSVTKKGEYTVLTYSLSYVDNKFTNYHDGDSSTVSVYLKPNKQGKLEPAYLYTSFHYAGRMVEWKDVKKDAQGRPVVRVERGSHALHPYGTKETVPTSGLHVLGDGRATMNGKALPNRMTWLAAQKNITGATYLDPAKKANAPVWNRYFSAYPERREPFHPSLFKR